MRGGRDDLQKCVCKSSSKVRLQIILSPLMSFAHHPSHLISLLLDHHRVLRLKFPQFTRRGWFPHSFFRYPNYSLFSI
jgi:hypothetical protein